MSKGKFPNERKTNTTPMVEEKPTIGIVTNCKALVMRSKPEADAEIISVMTEGVELIIDMKNSTENFYRVANELASVGYCRKEFVKIKEQGEQ